VAGLRERVVFWAVILCAIENRSVLRLSVFLANRFNGTKGVAVFHWGDIVAKQARAVFDVPLRQFLFFTNRPQAISDDRPRLSRTCGAFNSRELGNASTANQQREGRPALGARDFFGFSLPIYT
jgi:hypothetical protein